MSNEIIIIFFIVGILFLLYITYQIGFKMGTENTRENLLYILRKIASLDDNDIITIRALRTMLKELV